MDGVFIRTEHRHRNAILYHGILLRKVWCHSILSVNEHIQTSCSGFDLQRYVRYVNVTLEDGGEIPMPYPACVSTTLTRDPLEWSSVTFSAIHTPYHITWQSSDIKTLSPAPPTSVCAKGPALATWVPGTEPVKPLCYTESPKPVRPLVIYLAVDVPIISIALICGWWWCCCRRPQHAKNKRTARQVTAVTGGCTGQERDGGDGSNDVALEEVAVDAPPSYEEVQRHSVPAPVYVYDGRSHGPGGSQC